MLKEYIWVSKNPYQIIKSIEIFIFKAQIAGMTVGKLMGIPTIILKDL